MEARRIEPLSKWQRLSAFGLVALCAVAPFIWYSGIFGRAVHLPAIDTSAAFQVFSYTYSGVVDTGALPLWNPFSLYGQPFFYWSMLISPAMHFSLWLGYAFSVSNVWWLFLLSVFIESVIFYIGTFILCRYIKLSILASLFAVFICISTNFWLVSFYTNYRSLYLLPFILLINVRFFDTGAVKHIAWAAAIGVVLMFGNAAYYAPLLLYLFSFVLIYILFARHRFYNQERLLTFSGSVPAVLFLILVILIYLFCVVFPTTSSHALYFLRPGRGEDLSIPIQEYVVAADLKLVWKALEFFVSLPLGHFYPTVYLGVFGGFLALIGAESALRNRAQTAGRIMAIFAIVILLFGATWDGVAYLTYYFPGMEYVRQTEMLLAFLRYSLIVLAAIGFAAVEDRHATSDKLAKAHRLTNAGLTTRSALYLIVIALPLAVFIVTKLNPTPGPISDQKILIVHFYMYLALALALFGAWSAWALSGHRYSRYGSMILFLLGTVSLIPYFKAMDAGYNTSVPKKIAAPLLKPAPWVFSEERGDRPPPVETAIDNQTFAPFSGFFWALHEDLCVPRAGNDTLAASVALLLKKGMRLPNNELLSFMSGNGNSKGPPFDRPHMRRILGCDDQKLHVSTSPRLVGDTAAAIAAIRRDETPWHDVIVASKVPTKATDTGALSAEAGRSEIDVLRFRPGLLEVRVRHAPAGAWLVYADAFDPHWHAIVNGASRPIAVANLAFKAVPLQPGENRVTFVYRNMRQKITLYAWSAFGVLITLVLCAYAIRSFVKEEHRARSLSNGDAGGQDPII